MFLTARKCVMTFCVHLRTVYLCVEQVLILVWALNCDSPGLQMTKKCSSVMATLELKVKMNILRTVPWIRFPSSRLALPSASSSVSSLSRFRLVWQRDEDVDVVEREESRLVVQHALVPVLVDLIGQGDDIALSEAQLSLVLWIKVVQRLTARLLGG